MVNFCPLNVQKWLATSEADTCREIDCVNTITLVGDTELLNTLTSMQHFYSIFGHIPVGRLPGTIKGPFKAIRYYLGG